MGGGIQVEAFLEDEVVAGCLEKDPDPDLRLQRTPRLLTSRWVPSPPALRQEPWVPPRPATTLSRRGRGVPAHPAMRQEHRASEVSKLRCQLEVDGSTMIREVHLNRVRCRRVPQMTLHRCEYPAMRLGSVWATSLRE